MDRNTSGLLSKADVQEISHRRMMIAKAEIGNRLAEKELQDWYRTKHSSRSTSDVPQLFSSQAFASRYKEILKSLSPTPRAREAVPAFHPTFDSRTKQAKIPPFEEFLPHSSSDSQSEVYFQPSSPHSYLDFKLPSTLDTPFAPPPLSRDFPNTPHTELDCVALLSKLGDPKLRSAQHPDTEAHTDFPKTTRACHHFQCIEKEEHERILHEKLSETEHYWEERLHSLEQRLRAEYESKANTKERRGTDSDEGEVPAKALSDELLRRQFEDQLAEETDKSEQQHQEIVRLERLLAAKSSAESELVADLRREVDALSKDIDEKVTKVMDLTELVAEKEGEIDHLAARLKRFSRLEEENSQLLLELTDLREKDVLRETLQISLQELEQENYSLRKDYQDLYDEHSRLTQLRDSSEELHFKPSNSLKRRFGSLDSAKYEDLRNQLKLWKSKHTSLALQCAQDLEALKNCNSQLRSEFAAFVDEFVQRLQDSLLTERPPSEASVVRADTEPTYARRY